MIKYGQSEIINKQELPALILSSIEERNGLSVGNVLTEDGIGSGQRRLGMVVYITEEDSRTNITGASTPFVDRKSNIIDFPNLPQIGVWESDFKRRGWFSEPDLSGNSISDFDIGVGQTIYNTARIQKYRKYRCVINITENDESQTLNVYLTDGNVGIDGSEVLLATFDDSGIKEFDVILPTGAPYEVGYLTLKVEGTAGVIGPDWNVNNLLINSMTSIAFGNGVFVAVGDSNSEFFYSTDGLGWAAGDAYNGGGEVHVTFGNGLFVVIGGSRAWYSANGINWSGGSNDSTLDGYGWKSICYGNSLFVAVGDGVGARCVTSPDGITWTLQTGIPINGWYSVTFGLGLFVAVGNTGYGAPDESRIVSSPDGVTWTPRSADDTNDLGGLHSIAFGGGLFVTISRNFSSFPVKKQIQISADGEIWTGVDSIANYEWSSVAFGGGQFVAVALNSDVLMYSSDGINWTSSNTFPTTPLSSIAYGNNIFVAIGNDKSLTPDLGIFVTIEYANLHPYTRGSKYRLQIDGYYRLSNADKISELNNNNNWVHDDGFQSIEEGHSAYDGNPESGLKLDTLIRPGKYYLDWPEKLHPSNNIPQWFIDSNNYGVFLEVEAGHLSVSDNFYVIKQRLWGLDGNGYQNDSGRVPYKSLVRIYQEEESFWSEWRPETYLGTPESFDDNLRFRDSRGISWYKRNVSPIASSLGSFNIPGLVFDITRNSDYGLGFDLEVGKEYQLVIDSVSVADQFQIFCGTNLVNNNSSPINFRFRANDKGLYLISNDGSSIDITDIRLYEFTEEVFDYAKYLTSQTGGGGISGQSYLIVNGNQDTPELNGTDLVTQYNALKLLTPYGNALSATNRATLLVFPGDYNLTTDSIVGSNFCDIVGIGDNNNIMIRAEGNNKFDMSPSPDIILDNLRFHSITTDELEPKNSNLVIADDSPTVTLKNLIFSTITADNDYGDLISTPETEYIFNGYYENIISINNASIFSSETNSINLSGKFIGCKNLNNGVSVRPIGQNNGNYSVTLSGIFIDCGNENIGNSFGVSSSGSIIISGYFENCVAGDNSFGSGSSGSVTISGTFTNCKAGNFSFGTTTDNDLEITYCKFTDCIAGDNSFGYSDGSFGLSIGGTFTNCKAGDYSFGSGFGTISSGANFIDCEAGNNSFLRSGSIGNDTIDLASGSFIRCKGGSYCFGSTLMCAFGISEIKVEDCVGVNYCFGSTQNSTSNISGSSNGGEYKNCRANQNSFGRTNNLDLIMNGRYIDCRGANNCFGFSLTGTVTFGSNIIKDCTGGSYCFGSSTSSSNITVDDAFTQRVENCKGNDYCFGYSNTGNVTTQKYIVGCYAGIKSFGSSTSSSSIITIPYPSLIKDCEGNYDCFGAVGVVTISGTIDNCVANTRSFGYSLDSNITIDGIIKNCVGIVENCFGSSNNGDTYLGGTIIDCILIEGTGFGCSNSGTGNVTIGGNIIRCISAGRSFGSSNFGTVLIHSAAIIDSCTGNSSCFGCSFSGNINIEGKLTNCKSDDGSFGYTVDTSTITLSGTFTDCKSGNQSFGCGDTALTYVNTATYIRCIAGNDSFIYAIADGITINGTYIDCIAGDNSFGGTPNGATTFTLNGTYDKCISGNSSFGFSEEGTVIVSGIFENCKSGNSSFGNAILSTLSGTFIDCISGDRSYGGNIGGSSTLSGKFERCISGRDSFGSANHLAPGGNQILSGIFIECISGEASFGFLNNGTSDITLSGTFIRCVAGLDNEDDFGSFGCNSASSVGSVITLSGTFEACKSLTQRSFGYSEDIINISGNLKNCSSYGGFGQSPLFTLTNTGVIDSCSIGTFGMGSGTISGTLKNLLIDGSGLTSDTITVTATAKIEDCTVRAATGYYCVAAPSSTTVRILRSNFNLTTPYLNITNSITEVNALNIKDIGI